jgi:hypothetical protein
MKIIYIPDFVFQPAMLPVTDSTLLDLSAIFLETYLA